MPPEHWDIEHVSRFQRTFVSGQLPAQRVFLVVWVVLIDRAGPAHIGELLGIKQRVLLRRKQQKLFMSDDLSVQIVVVIVMNGGLLAKGADPETCLLVLFTRKQVGEVKVGAQGLQRFPRAGMIE